MAFDPYLGYVPSGQGQGPLSAYNMNYNPDSGQQAPTGGVGNNPYGNMRYQFQGPQFNGQGGPQELYSNYSPYFGDEIDKMAQNNRGLAVGGGMQLGQNLNNYTRFNYGQAADLRDQQTSAYDQIAQGRGGYTDDEKEAILNNPELQKLRLSQGDKDSNYLSEGEQAGISGNPYQAAGYAKDATDQMSGLYGNFAGQIGDDLGSQEASVNAAMQGAGAHTRGEVNTYGNKSDQELSDIAQLTRGAVGDTRSGVEGAVGQAGSNVRSYIDPNELTASDEYMKNYQVGPQDMQGILNQAGRAVGSRAVMDEELLNQQANANGNVNPMALAAARNRIRVTGGINAGNAMSDAAIKAKQLQLSTSQGRENTRLGAEQGYAGMGTANEQQLGQQDVNSQMGLGQQELANEQYMGTNTLGQQNKVSDAALQNEQYLGTQNVAGQQGLGASRLSNTQQLLGTGMQQAQYGAGLNTAALQGAEQQASGRAGTLAGNRQTTNQYNQGQDFTRGSAIYNAGSAANLGFANNKQAQEGEYRGYLGTAQNQANQNTTIGQQQQITNQGQMVQGANQATTGAVANYAVPGFGQQIFQDVVGTVQAGAKAAGGVKAKGGVSRGPETALIGEAGPELLVDLADKYGIPKHEDGFVANSTGTAPSNPLYDSIRRRALSSSPDEETAAKPDTSSSKGILGEIGDALGPTSLLGVGLKITDAIRNRNKNKPAATPAPAPTPMAFGGVVIKKPGAGGKAGHHPYGKKGLPKSKMLGIPHAELVTKPQIRTLGATVPQAVIPLNNKKGNKVNLGDLPDLLKQYGV